MVQKYLQKLILLKILIPKFKNIIFVGGMANNILEYKGFGIGKSIREKNCESIIEDIFSLAKNIIVKSFFQKMYLLEKILMIKQ